MYLYSSTLAKNSGQKPEQRRRRSVMKIGTEKLGLWLSGMMVVPIAVWAIAYYNLGHTPASAVQSTMWFTIMAGIVVLFFGHLFATLIAGASMLLAIGLAIALASTAPKVALTLGAASFALVFFGAMAEIIVGRLGSLTIGLLATSTTLIAFFFLNMERVFSGLGIAGIGIVVTPILGFALRERKEEANPSPPRQKPHQHLEV